MYYKRTLPHYARRAYQLTQVFDIFYPKKGFMPKGPVGQDMSKMSPYAKRMDRLSKRIFGETVYPMKDEKSYKIVRMFSHLPMEQDEMYNSSYYPPHPMFFYLSRVLRLHGLYRDEHQDFKEEMTRLRALRGKVIPKRGEGKRATMRKQGLA